MRAALASALLAGLATLSGCSPFGGGAFRCETDADCAGGPSAGRCETAVGFCSFEDSSCSSGYRFGTSSGGSSGSCVGDQMPMIDAPPNPDDGDVIDMAPEIDARLCYGGPHEICLTTLPTMPRTLPATINTDNDCDQVVTPAGGVPLCVVSGTAITIDNTRAEGSRPLVIVATETINVTGNLDVSSRRMGNPGAGANAAGCVAATMGENDGGGAAGGGGGGFGAAGGSAGFGDNNQNGGAANSGRATGGTGGAMSVGAFIRGGCRGADGGSTNGPNNGSDNGTNFGAGSNGGGAVYLIAVTSITVQMAATITASGGGGNGGDETSGGGGGGGSGGLVGLDAPAINVMGRVAANGGGGGGGAGNSDGGNGQDGFNPSAMMPNWNQRANGGNDGQQSNSPGGRGGATGSLAGENTSNSDGGSGGGGGGVGVIWTHGTLTGTQVSPPATPI